MDDQGTVIVIGAATGHWELVILYAWEYILATWMLKAGW